MTAEELAEWNDSDMARHMGGFFKGYFVKEVDDMGKKWTRHTLLTKAAWEIECKRGHW